MEFKRCYGCMRELDAPGNMCPRCGYDNTNDTAKQPGHALPCGTVLGGRYVIGRVLGQGGFGITYLGWNLTLEIAVCIKEYFPDGAAMRSSEKSQLVLWGASENAQSLKKSRESFVKEARKAVKLSDLSSVVKVWDVFYENETAYIVMNYIEGETLKRWLIKLGSPIDEKTCFAMLEPVMRDLQQVHERGIIHRDIKPDNLMRTPDGELKLLDLGAAKDLSGSSGQSSYMVASQGFSPVEQYTRHGKIGPWTDVYAMCATIYYCVTGRLLPTPTERMSGEEADFGFLSPALRPVLIKGLAVKPEDRIQTMGELLDALRKALASGSASEKKKQAMPRKKKALPLILATALAAALLFFGGMRFAGRQSPVMTEPPTPTATPVAVETAAPMPEPTVEPTVELTPEPTREPTPEPTSEPSMGPTPEPMIPAVAATVSLPVPLGNAAVGDTVLFGAYEQDNNIDNGKEDIEWLVLDKEENRLLLISKYALDCQPYNAKNEATSWISCSLRKWLYGPFMDAAFTSDEKNMIPVVQISTNQNSEYETSGGDNTVDQVFLLSIDEAEQYFESDQARQCFPTSFAVAKGCRVDGALGTCVYWLRSPGLNLRCATYVNRNGTVSTLGYEVPINYVAVRPVIWIELDT